MHIQTSRRNSFEKVSLIIAVFKETFKHMRLIQDVGVPQTEEEKKKLRALEISWARTMLKITDVRVMVSGAPVLTEPCLFVSNHMGYLDIPVLKGLLDASFIAKSEVRRWFIFGPAAAAARTVFVDRSNQESRKSVADQIGRFIMEQQRSVCVFPEGTSSSHGKDWKRGSLVIAEKFHIRVQPIRIAFKPLRPCAYITRDNFLTHLWRLLDHRDNVAYVHIFEPRSLHNVDADVPEIQKLVQTDLNELLLSWGEWLEPYIF